GSRDALQKTDGPGAPENDGENEQPEEEEAEPRMVPPAGEGCQRRVDGFAADPGLNAEPAASNQRAQDCGDICAEDSEGRARKHRKWNAVFSSGGGIQGLG